MDNEAQIESFIAKFSDGIAAEFRAARADMQRRLPGSVELVYDNYNALAIAYGSSEKLSDVVFSIACFPRWVRLFFNHGADVDDPDGRWRARAPRCAASSCRISPCSTIRRSRP